MIVVKVRDRDIKAAPMGPVTTGSVGLPVSWHFSEEWDDLAKTAVFRVGNDGTEITVAVLEDLCLVPDELLVQDNAGENLWIGVYGWAGEDDGEGNVTVAMPTIWTYTRIQDGSQPSGIEPPEGTPGWSAQIQNATDEALRVAHGVAADAAAGEFDGISPAVTISEITHGHSVTITDRDHPTGQSFNVMDGDSAYEQAVAGGYTGTEAQFNEELASFKTLSEQAADSAAAAAQSESNAAGSATTATTKAQEAADSAGQALIRMNSADTSAQDAEAYAVGKRGGIDVGSTDPAYHNNAKYYAEQAASSASDAATAKGAAETAQDKAEDAQEAAEQAQAAAEEAARSVDADRTNGRLDAVEQTTTATTIGPVALATFDASVAGMPLKGLTVNIKPAQAGSGDPSPENNRSISGWTTCKLHRTGVSLIGGDAFVGNTFSKTATGYQLSYNGSSISNRASAAADIMGLPAGRYTIEMLNPSYPEGAQVNIRRNTAGSVVTMGVIISSTVYGRRTYDIPENTTILQVYIVPDTMPLNTSITMSDIVLVREGDISEPYKGNTYNITFPTEAGTVYGGTFDVVNRKLNSYPYYSSYNGETIIGPWISSMDVYTPGATPTLGAQVVDMGGAATSYDLSDVPEITTLFGENNIWANRGDVTVTYGAYLEMLKSRLDRANSDLANLRACIAPTENGDTASQTYAQGAYFFRNGSFCVALLEIPSGDQFTLGTNYKVVSVAEAILAMSFVILEQPQDVEASIGVDGTFSVVARGASGYVWQYWTPNNPTWSNSSTTTSDYTLEVTETRYTYRYRCKVTGLDGSVIYSQPVKYVRPS